jgi:hypothetical protein
MGNDENSQTEKPFEVRGHSAAAPLLGQSIILNN